MPIETPDLCFNIIGIHWHELTYSKIQTFFEQPQSENDQLEFKSYNAADKALDKWHLDLAKEICALLNSDGGILIWGAPRENKESGYTSGKLTPIISSPNKEDLLRQIIGKIKELPTAVKVEQLMNPNGDGSIYIFQVKTSEFRPHQASDIYYIRIGGEKRPAPHYYIEAMMKRIKYPRLVGCINFDTFQFVKKGHQTTQWWIRVDLRVIVENESPFQNEESPRIILYCEHGNPIRYRSSWPAPEFQAISRPLPSHGAEVIHYGEKFQRGYSLGFNYDDLKSEGFQSGVALKFGGRFSPLKLVHYTLDLSFFDHLKYIEGQDYPLEYEPEEIENGLIVDSKYGEQYYELWDSIDYP